MGEPVVACERCGYSGPSGADGCPRCAGAETTPFRVPPLAAPAGPDRFEQPAACAEATPPAGGYVDLDLGEEGAAAPAPAPARVPPVASRVPGEWTRPAFTAVVPEPQSAKSAVPVLAAVGVGCLALIGVGAWFAARGAGDAPAPPEAPSAAAPAEGAASAPVPAPGQAHAQPTPSSAAPVSPAAAARPPPRPQVSREPTRAEQRRTRQEQRGEPAHAERAPAVVAAVVREEPSPATAPIAPAQTVAATPASVPIPPPPALVEEAPRHPTEGFRRPQMAEPGCVQSAIRLPRDAASRVSGPVTVRFAVGTAGEISLFQVLGDVPDPRIADALATAVRGCRFIPGADAAGTPTRLWVTMPIRFAR